MFRLWNDLQLWVETFVLRGQDYVTGWVSVGMFIPQWMWEQQLRNNKNGNQ